MNTKTNEDFIKEALPILKKARDGLGVLIDHGQATVPEERAYASVRDAIWVLEGNDLSKTIAFTEGLK